GLSFPVWRKFPTGQKIICSKTIWRKRMRTVEKIGLGLFLGGLIAFMTIPFLGTYTLSEESVMENTKDIHREKMSELLAPMYGQQYSSSFSFMSAFAENFDPYNDELKSQQLWDQVILDDYTFPFAKAALQRPVRDSPWLFLGL